MTNERLERISNRLRSPASPRLVARQSPRDVPEAAAEEITRAIAERVAADRQPLENAVATNVLRGDRSADRPSPLVIRKDAVQLPGGLICTVLSPGREQLVQPRRKWVDAVYEAKLNPRNSDPRGTTQIAWPA